MTTKAEGAFRTIREVADWLGVPTHVLRFWESKFDLVAPVKGAGGRRYYRPEDMRLLGGIKVLLHDQGQTIRGVAQRIADEGPDGVMDLAPAFAGDDVARRTRRVIRTGGETPPPVRERGRLTLVGDAEGPDDEDHGSGDGDGSHEPSAPDDGPPPGEEGDGTDPAEPAADPAVAPGDAGQPVDGIPPSVEDAPAPEAIPGVEPAEADPSPYDGVEMPDPAEAPPMAVQVAPPSLAALRRLHAARGAGGPRVDRRRLRRIVRRLRGLVAEIEEEMAADVA